jgi:PBP1b-binding outer membrane lipoprotein LpoB
MGEDLRTLNVKKMKKISILSLVLTLCFTSCDNYLDVNENKNKATNVTPDLVLPQALGATGRLPSECRWLWWF